MRITLTIIIHFLICINLSGQGYFEIKKPHPYFVSPEINYNAAINEFGLGGRMERTVLKHFRVGMHVNYFPGINITKDLYAGIRVGFTLLKSERRYAYRKYTYDHKRPDLYVFGQIDKNWWISKKSSSFTPFVGIGSSYGKSYLKYYVEAKYNASFNESWLNAGVTANMYGFKNRKRIPQ